MKQLKNALKFLATGFLVLLVSLCIYTFVITDVLKKDYVNVFGYTYFVVATGSMSGTIEVDDIIFVKVTKEVNTNDVITFKNKDGDIITHRLITKNGNAYVTKGDVNNVADEPIKKNQIIGKVTFVVSPSFILKSIAIFLIVFILLALVNFDNIIKKYILRDTLEKKTLVLPKQEVTQKVEETPKVEEKPILKESSIIEEKREPEVVTQSVIVEPYTTNKIPEEIFKNPKNRYDEPSSGLTVTISIDEMEMIQKIHERETEREDQIELLEDYDDKVFTYEPAKKKNQDKREKETIDFIVSLLKCKKSSETKARMNKKWLEKYQYVYRLCQLLLLDELDEISDDIEKPPFKEIYDYDLDKIGLTQSIRNRIYDMPIYVFLRILTYTILYNDDEMFDGIFKIMKYKTMIDKDKSFIQLDKYDTNPHKQVKTLIAFMQKISNKFDNKHVFELDRIERLAKIRKY